MGLWIKAEKANDGPLVVQRGRPVTYRGKDWVITGWDISGRFDRAGYLKVPTVWIGRDQDVVGVAPEEVGCFFENE